MSHTEAQAAQAAAEAAYIAAMHITGSHATKREQS